MSASRSLVTADSVRNDPTASEPESHVAHLGEAIATLAARLHAATYELLVLLREFDDCAGWNNGCLSCAQWTAMRLVA
jgi:hypothetical protein